MRSRVLAAVAAVLVLAGCGGSDGPSTSAATRATSTPTPMFVEYGDGMAQLEIKDEADVAGLEKAPEDFVAFILRELQTLQAEPGDASCAEAAIGITAVDGAGFANGSITDGCGGYAVIWARVSGEWREIVGHQDLPDCATLKKYSVPERIAGSECLEGAGPVAYP